MTERFSPKNDSGEPYSSWVHSIIWNDGVLILHRYDDNPENRTIYRYEGENITYDIFLDIKDAYANNRSIGKVINERIINNTSVSAAKKYSR